MKQLIAFTVLLAAVSTRCQAQNVPEIGAQVWIEPGDTPEQIDQWFKLRCD